MLHPGADCIQGQGGIHTFMQWERPILSDSGGYQVYSLIHRNKKNGKVEEDGVIFRSPLDGRKHFLTPEKSIAIQFALGVDMMVCLDDPRPNTASRSDMEKAVQRSIRWAKRCKEEYERQMISYSYTRKKRPLLFGVVQGGTHKDLRKRCVEGLLEIGFDGYGFGARHIDEEGNFLKDILGYTASLLPEELPRFALGVGNPGDIVKSYELGWDMFDCVVPTREGRHGRFFVLQEGCLECEVHSITHARWKEEKKVLEEGCDCEVCVGGYSCSYIHHLFKVKEFLGPKLLATHNLRLYQRLMERLKEGGQSNYTKA
jgi:queuine tRNA-ribosyltransferase